MATRHSARTSARQLLVAVLLALIVCSSFSTAAKCNYSRKKSPDTPAVTPSTESNSSTATETPTVVAAEANEATKTQAETENVSQFTTPEPATSFDQGGSVSPQTSENESSTQTNNKYSQQSILPTQASAEGGGAPQTASATSAHAPFGDITSQKGGCVVGNPNTFISTADVNDQWERRISKDVSTFHNLIFDQIVHNNASLSYCVRWDNNEKLSKTTASKFEAMLSRQFKLWNHWLIGYDCWPYEKIDIKIVGFAVRDASLLGWSDDSLGKIYEGVLDDDGIPKCPDECYKHQDQQANADTSACKGKPFDMSLWPSEDVPGQNVDGAGGDWGQRVEVKAMLETMNDEQMMTLAHEIGHGFGLPDFYGPSDKSSTFPAALMDQSETLTDADGWMLRRVLENIKSRYNF